MKRIVCLSVNMWLRSCLPIQRTGDTNKCDVPSERKRMHLSERQGIRAHSQAGLSRGVHYGCTAQISADPTRKRNSHRPQLNTLIHFAACMHSPRASVQTSTRVRLIITLAGVQKFQFSPTIKIVMLTKHHMIHMHVCSMILPSTSLASFTSSLPDSMTCMKRHFPFGYFVQA